MNGAWALQRAMARRPSLYSLRTILKCKPQGRRFSAIPTSDETLPLKGIRVLDMTRVLAGVGSLFIPSGRHQSPY